MKQLGLIRSALTVGAAAALLAGCGGAQEPILGPKAIPQSRGIREHIDRHNTESSDDLIYVSTRYNWVYILDYSSGQLLDRFNPPLNGIEGMCTDSSGNVYVLGAAVWAWILKYAHGATTPSESIEAAGYIAYACSVDPTSGNLAVLLRNTDDDLFVAVYPNGSGDPTYYQVSDSQASGLSCAYDNSGDLLVDFDAFSGVRRLAQLPAGGRTFGQLDLKRAFKMSQLFWATSYFAVGYPNGIYHLRVSGSNASIIGRTEVQDGKPLFWIQDGGTLLEPYGKDTREIGFWQYPQGGKAIRKIPQVDNHFRHIISLVVSVSPSRKR